MSSTSQGKEVELIKDLREENSDSILVMLKKIPDQQLGMGIGKRTRGILVTSLQPGSVAAEKLKVGDRLMAVNGVAVTDQVMNLFYSSLNSMFYVYSVQKAKALYRSYEKKHQSKNFKLDNLTS